MKKSNLLILLSIVGSITAAAQYYPQDPYGSSGSSGFMGETALFLMPDDKTAPFRSEVFTPDMLAHSTTAPLGYVLELIPRSPCFDGDPRQVVTLLLGPGLDRKGDERCANMRVMSRDRILISDCRMGRERDAVVYSVTIQRCSDAAAGTIPGAPKPTPTKTQDPGYYEDETGPYNPFTGQTPSPSPAPSPAPSAAPSAAPSKAPAKK